MLETVDFDLLTAKKPPKGKQNNLNTPLKGKKRRKQKKYESLTKSKKSLWITRDDVLGS